MGFLHFFIWRLFSRCWDFDMSGESQFRCGQSRVAAHTQFQRSRLRHNQSKVLSFILYKHTDISSLRARLHAQVDTLKAAHFFRAVQYLDIMPGFNFKLVIQNSPPCTNKTHYGFSRCRSWLLLDWNIWMISHWLCNTPSAGQMCVNAQLC